MRNKVEIISIDLNFDIEEEIKKASDNISNIIDKKVEIINSAKTRLAAKLPSKAEIEATRMASILASIFEIMKKNMTTDAPYSSMEDIAKAANITLHDGDLIKIGSKIKNYISTSTSNKWILDKKKVNGKYLYAVAKFGS